MLRMYVRRLLLASVAALVVLALGVLLEGAPGAAHAQTLPPRPTAVPTEAPADEPHPTAVVPGRITGTVIDQRSDAPAAGVVVQVGDELLTSDANGNYDRNGLAPGSYRVALKLASGQGVAAQGDLRVTVSAGQTTVQHLFFTSSAPAEAAAPAPPVLEPAALPAALPSTGAGRSGAAGLLPLAALLLLLGLAVGRQAR